MPSPKRSVNWQDVFGDGMGQKTLADAQFTVNNPMGGGGFPQLTRKVLDQYSTDPGFGKYLDFAMGPEKTSFINQNWKTLPDDQQEALYKLLYKYSQMYQSIHRQK